MLIQAPRAFLELRRLLAGESFDILHAHTRGGLLVGLLATKLLRRPVLFTNHNFAQRRALYRWAASQPLMHTVLLTANMAKHYGLETRPPQVSTISACCADRVLSEPLVQPPLARSKTDPLRLVGVGSIVSWKNWHLILEALSQLNEAERGRVMLDHWGPTLSDPDSLKYGLELNHLRRSRDLEARVVFHGPTQNVTEALRAANWFVLPSTNEPCSVALIEALALGIPALASESGGNVDIVQQGKTGLLFRPDSSADLADKLRTALRGEITTGSPAMIRKSVQYRCASVVGRQYVELYEQIFRGNERRHAG